jgi:anti-sigma regulatory factor (Ser/Thr protein kinase)
VAVRLRYLGEAFDPSIAPPPSVDGSRDSGFGLYLITNSVDDVRYYYDDGGRNCIELIMNRKH